MQENLRFRSKLYNAIRNHLCSNNFNEIETPILTKPTPEGARDYLVPSRVHKTNFFALPQSPQLFKQLLMISGMDKYFQIAKCFRDEDLRADRQPEFTQLDIECSFSNEDDIINLTESLMRKIFTSVLEKNANLEFPRMTYTESMDKYGCDKPDLRNPLRLVNVTNFFKGSGLQIFENLINKGAIVNCIQAINSEGRARSFYDNLNKWAQEQGKKGLGYMNFENLEAKGPLAKNFNPEKLKSMLQENNFNKKDGLLFICDMPHEAYDFGSKVIAKVGDELELIDKNKFEFCWIVDYPMYEKDPATGKVDFSHNPFSMPQGGMDALIEDDPIDILAYQYDIVCNGIELSSGAIRNHRPDIMKKAFEIAGYDEETIKTKFSALFEAFHYGVPPHGGCAPGLDRIIMLLSDNENIREVIAFPFNQKAQDLMMNAPVDIDGRQLKELSIKKI